MATDGKLIKLSRSKESEAGSRPARPRPAPAREDVVQTYRYPVRARTGLFDVLKP